MAKIKFVSDEDVFYTITDLIISSEKNLVIIHPSLSNITHFLEKIQDAKAKGADVYVVTQPKKEETHQKTVAFLQKIGCRVFMDDLVNARMIVSDQKQLFVSSADLSRTVNDKFFDAGILTGDRGVINSALEYAERVMQYINKKRKKEKK